MARAEGTSRRAWIYVPLPALILLLGLSSPSSGGGWGLGFKVGAQTLDSPITGNRSTRTRFEVELASPLFADDYMDLALSFGGSSLATVSEYTIAFDSLGFIEETLEDHLILYDLRLAARFYPRGPGPTGYVDDLRVKPYVGAGFGYFSMVDHWKDTHTETTVDAFGPGLDFSITDVQKGSETWAKGFFPFVTAGVNVAVTSHLDVLVEFQYDFNKKNAGLDFSGPIGTIGCRVRW
ncbi:MAG: outer membrane beta-barrel protein [Planctomycetes bacterium]|nr:outer membrane beta-barrel protein [Planctomycetota bacterium]